MNLDDLKNPFPASVISWRIGATNKKQMAPNPATKGIALAYIDARDVQRRLDDVCGPAGWQARHETTSGSPKVTCHLGIKCGDEWIWKSNGAGETDVEADKGAYSDAFKRAAVMWGIGEYLYHVNSPWVELKNGKIKDDELPKLIKILGGEFYSPLGVTKLIELARELNADIKACEDQDQLTALLGTKQSKDLINQLKTDRPGWWHGTGQPEGAPGLAERIETKKKKLDEKVAA